MKWKKIIVTGGFIVLLGLTVIVAYKKGYVDLSSHARNIESTYSKEESKTQEETKNVSEKKSELEDIAKGWATVQLNSYELVYREKDGIIESLIKDANGNITNDSSRYKVKNLGCSISKEKPEEMTMDYYPTGHEADTEGTLVTDSYYVTFTMEITNLSNQEWKDEKFFCQQNYRIGGLDEKGKFTIYGEPISRACLGYSNIGGAVYIEKGKTETITNCYIISQEELERANMLVVLDLDEVYNIEKLGGDVHCFVLDIKNKL